MSPRSSFLLAAVGLLAACREQPTALAPHTTPFSLETPAPFAVPPAPQRVKWRFRLAGDYSLHSPGVGADGTVYVSMSNGKLYAIAPDGTQRWPAKAGLGGGAWGPVSVGADGTIYVAGAVPTPGGGGSTGAIFAYTPAGTLKWKFDATNQFIIAGPNVGPDGNIYAVVDYPGIGLFSLTPAGQLRFSTGTFIEYGALGTEIAFGSGQLYFAFDMRSTGFAPSLFGYDLNGNRRFQVQGTMDKARPAVGPNGNVVVQSFPTGVGLSLAAYTPAGALAWSFYEFPGNTEENPDVGPDNVAYTVRNLFHLFAFNPNGTEKWRYVDPVIMFEPRVRPQNDQLFMGGRINYGQPGFFLAVSTAGTPLWRVDLPDEPGFAPYGQLVPTTRPVFSPDGNTAYAVTDVAGDGSSSSPYSFLYAIDISTSSGGNTTPAVTLAATTPKTINVGGSVSFRGSFTDPDAGDGPWSYKWAFGNGRVTGTATAPGTISATRTYTAAGTFKVVLRVTDARGAIGTSKAVTVRVQ
ncbi:MAG: PKD domain-containing protein [Gemmatimonadaceae bacterium]|nr:PKD domain-containing protein [Gemmatimonadaceae bacterium]